jgi:hypothetical protein
LINTTGKVARVWTIRRPQLNPPFPAFNRAIEDAVQQWEFEPLLVQGKPAPVCIAVTTYIDWQQLGPKRWTTKAYM